MSTGKRRGSGNTHTSIDDTSNDVAGNGLIHRRALLGRGIAVAGAMGAGASLTGAAAEPLKNDPWTLEMGEITPVLQVPSRFEKNVVRTRTNPNHEFRNSHARTPHHLLNGTVTPNSLHFSINHAGLPDIDPEQHKLVIHGKVKQPLVFTLESLSRYPLVTRMSFVECSGNSAPMFSNEPLQANVQALHGLASNAEWTGVPLSVLLDEAGADPNAKWVIAEGADAHSLDRSVPMKKAMGDALVAIYQNGERLMPGNGYPMRLLLPGYQGNMNVKFLRRLKVVDQPAMSMFESKTYSQLLPAARHGASTSCRRSKASSPIRRSGNRSRRLASIRSPASPIPATAASPRSWSPRTAARAGARPRCADRRIPRRSPASTCRGAGTDSPRCCRAAPMTKTATRSRCARSSWRRGARPRSRSRTPRRFQISTTTA